MGLFAFLTLGFPSFISTCGFGGWRNNWAITRRVCSNSLSSEDSSMFYESYFDPNDRWPNYAVGPIKHLHALGVLALNFSFYEGAMVILFEEYIPKPVAKYFFDTLNNQERMNAIRELVGNFEPDPVM